MTFFTPKYTLGSGLQKATRTLRYAAKPPDKGGDGNPPPQ